MPGIAIPLLVSVSVELLQWRLIPGRDGSLGDLVANTMGGAFAYAGLRAFLGLRRRPARAPYAWLAIILALCWIGGAAGASWALQPATLHGIVWVQLAPPRKGFERFDGSLRFRLSGQSLDNGTALLAESLPGPDGTGLSLSLDVHPLDGRPLPRRALLLRLANPLRTAVQVTQEGEDLVFQGPHNAGRLGLRSPSFRLPRALPPGSGTVSASLELGKSGARLEARAARQVLQRSLPITLGRAWELAAPGLWLPPWLRTAMGPVTIALAAVALGAAAAAAWPRPGAAAWIWIVQVTGLAVVPRAFGIGAGTPLEWAVAAAGSLAGLWAGSRCRDLRSSRPPDGLSEGDEAARLHP